MTEHWYHLVHGKQFGPFSFKGLKERASIGVLHPNDEVLRDGAKDWTEAGNVPGLFTPDMPEVKANLQTVTTPPNEASPEQKLPPWVVPGVCLVLGIGIGMALMALILSMLHTSP